MLVLMVFLPVIVAILCYPLCGKSEKAWTTPCLVVTGAVFAMALSLLWSPELTEGVDGFCGFGVHFRAGGMPISAREASVKTAQVTGIFLPRSSIS